jgi:cation diffusion facilitator family transporter
VADAVHSLSDLFTDAAIIFGVKYWVMPADEGHPYGHGKIEGAVTALIGVTVAVVAVEIAWDGVKTLAWGEPKVPGLAACCVALASVAVKEALYRWTHAVARRRNSPATEANAWHHRSDAISSLPVAAAVAAAHFWPSLKWLDAVGAVLVGGFILHVAWRIVKPAFEGLTDANCDEAMADIERIALGVKGVKGVHHVRTRRYGGTIQADLHVQVDRNMSLVDGHAIGHDVKAAVLAAGIGVTDATIHVEPDVA